jgi:nucleoid DNA-binding protein
MNQAASQPDANPASLSKSDIAERLAKRLGMTQTAAANVIQEFLAEIAGGLAKGSRIEFRDFGVFEPVVREARVAHNPRTMEKITVARKVVVKFKPGRLLKATVGTQAGAGAEGAAAEDDDGEDEG